MKNRNMRIFTTLLMLMLTGFVFAQKNKKPNILVIWGDDIGWSNLALTITA